MPSAHKDKQPRLTDSQIREHLEMNGFHGLHVSQQNIDDTRRILESQRRQAAKRIKP